MKIDLVKLNKKLKAVSDPAAFFGSDPKKTYHRLVRVCHVDFVEAKDRALANETFLLLQSLYEQLNGKASPATPVVLKSWMIKRPIASGDVADVYEAEGGKLKAPVVGIVKVCREEADNDLMERELQALKKLTSAKDDPRYQKYIPAVLDSFQADDRAVNVLQPAPDDAITLPQLIETYDLSDFRHVVWMFNRLLTVLGFAHRQGVIHGAVTPDHLLYIPQHHGLCLVGWTAATVDGRHIPYLSEKWEHLYPKEVSRKLSYSNTDIYMAARCIQQAIQPGSMPKEFKPMLDYCLAGSPHSRPDDAWEVQASWKETARLLYGAPKFIDMKEVAPQ